MNKWTNEDREKMISEIATMNESELYSTLNRFTDFFWERIKLMDLDEKAKSDVIILDRDHAYIERVLIDALIHKNRK